MREIKFRAWSEPLKLMQFFELKTDRGMLGKNGEIHREDYSKPLDVIWLCRIHHMQHHHGK